MKKQEHPNQARTNGTDILIKYSGQDSDNVPQVLHKRYAVFLSLFLFLIN